MRFLNLTDITPFNKKFSYVYFLLLLIKRIIKPLQKPLKGMPPQTINITERVIEFSFMPSIAMGSIPPNSITAPEIIVPTAYFNIMFSLYPVNAISRIPPLSIKIPL